MNAIEEINQDHQDLARTLKKHRGIRKIVEDLYPDSAHFIYELLQNAEDTGATETSFILSNEKLVFEHNGRSFTPADIRAITDIGEGTKSGDEDKIGRFGIGFKAVFAYTDTPRIWSPTFAFEISELVLPSELTAAPELGSITRFEFPFNNPKKPAQGAYSEILDGLEALSETSLLFLSNINSIRWGIKGSSEIKISRTHHTKYLVEVLKQTDGKITIRSHFLRLTEPVKELETQNIAVAFALDPLGTTKDFDALASLDKQFKIKPAIPGRVAVFFTAEKETSRLRFHLHAPFVPELSRASIKETPTNLPLFQQLASLAVEALEVIRNLGLLTGEFLAVLPNQNDDIPLRYQCIRRAIITAMNEKYLTPTYSKSHAPAKYLLQGRASLKSIISNEDLEFLVSHVGKMPEWAIGATQKNSDIDRFINGLAIKEWDLVNLLELLCNKVSVNPHYYTPYHHDPHHFDQPLHITSQEVKVWLANKSPEWHQQLYALIYKELDHDNQLWSRLKHAKIIRLKSGSYALGNKCFFPGESINQDDQFPYVDAEVYILGNSKNQQYNARKFLEKIGVCEVSEADLVNAILINRYSTDNFYPDINDFQRFVLLVEKEPKCAQLFSEYKIFQQANGQWEKPKQIYLDLPYINSGLTNYYKQIGKVGKQANCGPLSSNYQELGIQPERILKFLRSTGVQTALHIVEVTCQYNSNKEYLYRASGKIKTDGGVDSDWYIPSLADVINSKSLEISRLIWQTMIRDSAGKLEAKFRRNVSV